MSETVQLTSIEELAEVVSAASNGRRLITAVAGPPGAGKSTVAETLVELLNARTPGTASVFPMDGYHYDDMVLEARGWRSRKGAPHTFDVSGFAHTLVRLRRNDEDEVAVPVFDRGIEIARAGARIIPRSIDHIIVEGNYLLLDTPPWDRLDEHFDITVLIDVGEDELRRRLLERWADLSPAALDEKMNGNDLPNVRLVQSSSRRPDYILRLA